MGGNGAKGGDILNQFHIWNPGYIGQKGGDAIQMHHPVHLINYGVIYSGGGGGGFILTFFNTYYKVNKCIKEMFLHYSTFF